MLTFADWFKRSENVSFDLRAVINGKRHNSASDTGMDIYNPSTGQKLYTLPGGAAAGVDLAVHAARQAFDSGQWSGLAPVIRKAILQGVAAKIEAHQEELALLDSLEMGKPIAQALGDCMAAAHIFRYFAEFADKLEAGTSVSPAGILQYQRREPRGVVAAIVAWNYPLPNAALKIAPALAAGNSVVLKPSELASSSALRLAELVLEAGLPPGLLNVVPGVGATVGAALAQHAGIDFVAFTGSSATGSALMSSASGDLKPMQMECGGKSANIVFADCVDLDHVAADAAGRIFTNQGQLCVAGSRLIVHASIKDELIKRIAMHAKALVIGNALDPSTTFGPLATEARLKSVLAACRKGEAEGGVMVQGGHAEHQASGGWYMAPTIFDGVKADMALAQSDIFGPVLSVLSFQSVDDALMQANSSVYGLSATVWTKDIIIGQHMVERLKAGRVSVYAAAPDSAKPVIPMAAEPFGYSGYGAEAGRQGIEIYTRLKSVETYT